MKKRKIALLTLMIAFMFQTVVFAEYEDEEFIHVSNNSETFLSLDDKQKKQLEFEKAYLDSILSTTNKYFGSPEGFDEYGEIYIENNEKPHLVIAIAYENMQVNNFIEEMKSALPEDLISIRKVNYSKNDLLKVQDELVQLIDSGNTESLEGYTIIPSTKDQKVILSVPNKNTISINTNNNSLITKYSDLIEVQEGSLNIPAKSRSDAFIEMGGGIRISVGCSTGATATKDTREFLITAGHCIKNIGSTVSQGGTNIGTQHLSGYYNGGTDVGLILLTNTNKRIGNKYYYNEIANAEYDEKYTSASTALTGQLLCKTGITTGVTCGTVTSTSATSQYDGIALSNLIQIYKEGGGVILGGDSGGTVFNAYNRWQIVGLVQARNSGNSGTPEGTWGYVTKILPALSAGGGVSLYTSDTPKAVNPNN